MSSFNQRVVVSVLLCACSLTSSVFAAKKGGISDQSTRVVATSKAQQIGKGLSTIGNTADSSDAGDTTTSDTSTGSEVGSATRNCNFSGFDQNDLVNGAYAGGTSANGVSQINNGITFTSAKIPWAVSAFQLDTASSEYSACSDGQCPASLLPRKPPDQLSLDTFVSNSNNSVLFTCSLNSLVPANVLFSVADNRRRVIVPDGLFKRRSKRAEFGTIRVGSFLSIRIFCPHGL